MAVALWNATTQKFGIMSGFPLGLRLITQHLHH